MFAKLLRQKETLKNENRATFTNDQWKGIRAKVLGQTTAGGVAFLVWFLVWCSYLYGALYESPQRHKNFNILAVDYDGGVIGQSLHAAYEQLKAPTFFTVTFHAPEQYPTEQDMYKAVWDGNYWGAISATADASSRLSAALQGGEAAQTYNAADALHWIWNQQHYTTFSNSVVQAHMQQLIAATRIAYNKINGTHASSSTLNTSDPAAVQTLLNPIAATATNIQTVTFGSVALFNTISMVMPILQQFFFLLVLNGVLGQHQVYTKMTVRSSLIYRRIAGLIFTLLAALCQAGYFWAFRENWNVNGNQFVLTWMAYWLLMHIHLLVLDTISSVAPMAVMPFVTIAWIFINVGSTLSPLEAQAGFYHWGVALPGLNVYSVLQTIWSGGANNELYRALPVLFSWWFVANITTSLAHIRACHMAYKLAQEEGQDVENSGREKDVEAGAGAGASGAEASMSRQTTLERAVSRTMSRTVTNMERQRTLEMEHRQVYGPSIPPFGE